ncbi:MAG: 8-amino-7-oxononanoate synthase [Gammaproteobacteria bacterium]|nr:MAG: 8-amino-7-oxononanoate synthase [Gammaproteobacteria bacterium]
MSGSTENIIRHDWQVKEIQALFELPFNDLLFQAQQIHRSFFDPNAVQVSTLLSVQTGGCPEDCGYCPQSIHHKAEVDVHALMSLEEVQEKARAARAAGASRLCMGAAWRQPKERDFARILEMVKSVKAEGLETCVTLGMLTTDQTQRLKVAGLDYYNHNLDTSEAFYDQIITTRTYQDRLDTLENVREAGVHVCCGGIIGLGEEVSDRVGMLHTLATMEKHPESVPINQLVQVEGTPLQDAGPVDPIEFVRVIAVTRILMPASVVRLSAGREQMSDELQALCFLAGANSVFYGEKLLTTPNPDQAHDRALFNRLGQWIRPSQGSEGLPEVQLSERLADRHARKLYRNRRVVEGPQSIYLKIDGHDVVSFCSNDYLGLANHPHVRAAFVRATEQYGVGAGAAHLITGHTRAHHQLEEELAEFTGRDRALLFSTGYMANLGVLSAINGRQDRIYQDKLNHASLIDGGLLSQAKVYRYAHLDMDGLVSRLEDDSPAGGTIVTDGVFSMEGDIAPLDQLARIADEAGLMLMVDDAHGLGVLGNHGAGSIQHFGLSQHQVPIMMGTLGKAIGTFGAFVAGSAELIESLIQFARSYVYTTAPPAAIAEATRAAIRLIQEDSERRERLQQNILRFRKGIEQIGFPAGMYTTAIQIVAMPDAGKALSVQQSLEEQGWLVSAIRPPTAPDARLRVTLSSEHKDQDVDGLLGALDGLNL